MTYNWFSPAKINLFLYINGRRRDGYHLIQTLLQFLNYGDILSITPTLDGVINVTHATNSVYEISKNNNLIVKAAKLLQSYCCNLNDCILPGANIKIEKFLPIGGGLGGGSSNAATVLVALNNQWKCGLSMRELLELGNILGADIPFFINGKTSFVEGTGNLLTPVLLKERWYLVVIPPIQVSTESVFNDPDLKRDSPIRSLPDIFSLPFRNDCEQIVRKRFLIIEKFFLHLSQYIPCRLTGTGSCMFAEFDTEFCARQISLCLPKWMNNFVAKGINISPLYSMSMEYKNNFISR